MSQALIPHSRNSASQLASCRRFGLTRWIYADMRWQLVIPKHHGEKLTDIPDDALTEILVRYSFLPPINSNHKSMPDGLSFRELS